MLKELWNFIVESAKRISQSANYWFGFKNEKLHTAAKLGNTAQVLDLLSQGTYVDCKDKEGNTPLHIAAQNGCMQTIEQLLANKANLKAINYHKDTALHLAAQSGNTATALLLLKNGAVLTALNKDKDTPLHVAVNNGKLDTLISLIERNIKMDSTQYNSLLRNAVRAEKIEIINWLINNHPNRKNIDRHELLKIAVDAQASESLKFLMSCFSANVTKSQLNDLVNLASSNVDIQCVNLLIGYGADINNLAKPILTAVRAGQVELFRNLVASGANIYVNDEEGNTALHLAAQTENYGMLKDIIFRKMLNPKDTNNEGQTPKDIIEAKLQPLMVQLNQHRQNHTAHLESHAKKHHLKTERLLKFEDYSPGEIKRITDKRARILTKEVAEMNKAAQKHEAAITAKIRKLNMIGQLLSQGQIQYEEALMTPVNVLLPQPSAPLMQQSPGLSTPYYALNRGNTGKPLLPPLNVNVEDLKKPSI